MAADAFQVYDNWMHEMDGNLINLTSDVFKIALFDSSFTPNVDAGTGYNTTNEVATANGYTQGGQTETVAWTEDSTGVFTFDFTTAVWTASGGSIAARYAIVYDDTATGKPIVATCLLDNSPADVTATDGNTFTVNTATGIYTITRS